MYGFENSTFQTHETQGIRTLIINRLEPHNDGGFQTLPFLGRFYGAAAELPTTVTLLPRAVRPEAVLSQRNRQSRGHEQRDTRPQ